MKTRILLTGACGFIGHHIVEHILRNTNWDIVIIDKLTYASSGFARLRDIDVFGKNEERVSLFTHDFVHPIQEGLLAEIGQVDYIVHLGAETHVDNSIIDPMRFIQSNVVGTGNMLQFAREQKNLKKFIYFSTDEVFGPAYGSRSFREWGRYASGNPYSATKAGGEELAIAFANTYGLPILITHTMNVFGERQHNEKFIPLVVNKILKGETIQIHSNATRTKAGSRYWIHARNVASALVHLITRGYGKDEELVYAPSGITPSDILDGMKTFPLPVSKWNIVGEREVDNLELATLIHKTLTKLGLTTEEFKYELVDFHSSRPGHDLRYALNGEKLRKSGYNLPVGFEESLENTITWMVAPENRKWLDIGIAELDDDGKKRDPLLSPIQPMP